MVYVLWALLQSDIKVSKTDMTKRVSTSVEQEQGRHAEHDDNDND